MGTAIAIRNKLFVTLGICLAYAVAGQFGFLITRYTEWNAVFFWPPSGIALAAILLLGRQALPGIFLGWLFAVVLLGLQPRVGLFPETLRPRLTEAFSGLSATGLIAGLVIATASTLGPFVAARMLQNISPDAPLWTRSSDFLKGTAAMALACAVTGFGGMGALSIIGLVPADEIFPDAGMWWLAEFFGMLIFAPVIYFTARRLTTRSGSQVSAASFAPVVFPGAMAALALATFLSLWNLEASRISNHLAREANTATRSISILLQEAGRDLEVVRALFYAARNIDAEDFYRFTMRNNVVHLNVPGVQAISWAPRVTDMLEWEKRLHDKGLTGIKIYERDASGKTVGAKQRNEYFPVRFIQPREGNSEALGFDLASETARRQAIHRARDTGQLSMTSRLVLVQSKEPEPAVLISLPTYLPNVEMHSMQARRDNFTGVVTAVYLISPMLRSIQANVVAGIELHLFEESQRADEQWLSSTHSSSRHETGMTPPRLERLKQGLHGSAPVEFGGRTWQLVATAEPAFVAEQRTLAPFLYMATLLILGMALGGIFIERRAAVARVRAERVKTDKALLDAQEANESKEYFMAAASHDIKQPLYALAMLTDTLMMADKGSSKNPLLIRLRGSIEQMSQHFDDLMDMARFRDGTFSTVESTISLAELAHRIDLEIAPQCAAKGLNWRLDLGDASIVSDPGLLLRLFRNLLTNAAKYTQRGEVVCSAKVFDDFVEFQITDTGCGIPMEHQARLFEPFADLGASAQQARRSGTGLGLSIVAKINQALDLGLTVMSNPDEGTTFRFRAKRASVP